MFYHARLGRYKKAFSTLQRFRDFKGSWKKIEGKGRGTGSGGGGGVGQRLTKPSVLYSRDIQRFNRLLSIKRFIHVASSYENLSEQNYTRKGNNLLGIVWGQRNWLSVW